MAAAQTPHFKNDDGHASIEIGVKEFMCVGAAAPYDHPHVFIDMGDADEKVCPYCSTLYKYNGNFSADQTKPDGCLYTLEAV